VKGQTHGHLGNAHYHSDKSLYLRAQQKLRKSGNFALFSILSPHGHGGQNSPDWNRRNVRFGSFCSPKRALHPTEVWLCCSHDSSDNVSPLSKNTCVPQSQHGQRVFWCASALNPRIRKLNMQFWSLLWSKRCAKAVFLIDSIVAEI